MLESRADSSPFWQPHDPEDAHLAEQVEHGREEHLLLDPLPPAENNAIVLESMNKTGRAFDGKCSLWRADPGLPRLIVRYSPASASRPQPLGDLQTYRQPGYFIGIGHARRSSPARLTQFRHVARSAHSALSAGSPALFPIVHDSHLEAFHDAYHNWATYGRHFRSALFTGSV